MTGPTLPVGQEQTLRALATAMFRGTVAVALGTAVLGVVIGGVFAGVAGALSALTGSLIALAASLLTLWLIRRTAAQAPGVVMVASLGGFLLKMIILLAALTLAGTVEGVHRESLAVSMLAVFIVVAAAGGRAGYRMPMLSVEPDPSMITPATSGSVTGMSESPTGAQAGTDGRPEPRLPKPEHGG